jgi:hypothetical protein
MTSDSYYFSQHWDIRDGKSGRLRVWSYPDLIPLDVLSGDEQLVGLARYTSILPDGEVPQAIMLAHFFTRLDCQYFTGFRSHILG